MLTLKKEIYELESPQSIMKKVEDRLNSSSDDSNIRGSVFNNEFVIKPLISTSFGMALSKVRAHGVLKDKTILEVKYKLSAFELISLLILLLVFHYTYNDLQQSEYAMLYIAAIGGYFVLMGVRIYKHLKTTQQRVQEIVSG